MPTAILGRDCTISGGGLDNAQVKDVSISWQAKEVEWQELFSRDVCVWNAGHTVTLEVDLLASGDFETSNLESGDLVSVGGSASGTFVVTGIQRVEPLDGPVTIRVQMKRSN